MLAPAGGYILTSAQWLNGIGFRDDLNMGIFVIIITTTPYVTLCGESPLIDESGFCAISRYLNMRMFLYMLMSRVLMGVFHCSYLYWL